MNIIRTASELQTGSRTVCLAIGFFDGVHLGHQQIIRQTVANARQHDAIALVITFDRHPNTVVAPDRVPPLIYPLPRKLHAIETLGAGALLLIHFDRPFSELPGDTFIRGLARDLGRIHSLCVGADFTFGHRRGGNVALLTRLGAELGFAVHGIAAVSLDGSVISSTRIRQAIREGNLDLAGQMLGRPYSLTGRVIAGDRLGRRLGFPTANLDPAGLALPPQGVYAARTLAAGQSRRAVVNIGRRPTIDSPDAPLRIEAHLIDFDGDLYDQELELVIVEKLRDEQKFASVTELKEQIGRDIEKAALLP